MEKIALILLISILVSCKNKSQNNLDSAPKDSTFQSLEDSVITTVEPEIIKFDTFNNIKDNSKVKAEYIRRMKGINSGLRELDAINQKVFWNNKEWNLTIKKDSYPIKAYVNDDESETYDKILELYYWKGKLFLSFYQNHYYLFEKQGITGVLDSAFQIKEIISKQSVEESFSQFKELDSLILAPFQEQKEEKK